MVYHRSEPSSGDPRRHGRFSRDDDSDSRESRRDDTRYESRSKDAKYSDSDSRSYREDRYSGSRYSKDSRGRDDRERSRSRDRSDGSRYRDNGRSSRFNSGPKFNSEDPSMRYQDQGSRYSSGGSSHYQQSGTYQEQGSSFYSSDQNQPEDQEVPEEDKLQNQFQNDGSFLEMFKKMQQTVVKTEGNTESVATGTVSASSSSSVAVNDTVVPKLPMVGKRRGGRVLKTGMVKKLKKENPEEERPKDAWSMYMNEVRKYKEASCEEEGKTRPLVK